MTATKLVRQDRDLVQSFKRYQKRYLRQGKKPDVKKLLPEDFYSTMRLEGEKITKKEVRALFT